ncbi:unnamed protein product [Meloidogyne enterolobii]|uniref:Uncharacterized protein n=1 Tax=Meloidogyne enterolobii TaxID=390850 RepID=A0ACB1AF72_MELEN
MTYRKVSQQDLQHQSREIRSQLFEQIKCLEQRSNDKVAIFQEINDFLKKRAELDLQYSKELDKLVKSVMMRHKAERQRRPNWSIYSICNLWQQIVDDAKDEAKQRSIIADCRDIALLAAGEVMRVLNELSLAMKTYHNCYNEFSVLSAKLHNAEEQKRKIMEANSSLRKQNSIQKTFEKRNEKYEIARQKCMRARNEYLLCIDAANSSLYKYFADDVSNIIDCEDLGLDCWLRMILQNLISARKSACQSEMNALANLSGFRDSLQSRDDKQRFFESSNQTFMLPKRFDFKCEQSETIFEISTNDLREEFRQRHNQIRKRLEILRMESEGSWQKLVEMEKKMQELLAVSTIVEINEFGISDKRPSTELVEQELSNIFESYLQSFTFFLLNANLISRLEARANGINNGLKCRNINVASSKQNISDGDRLNGNSSIEKKSDTDGSEIETIIHQRPKRRIGSQTSTECQFSSPWTLRPKLFGDGTGEQIPLVVVSCIRALSLFALQHQGVFRISGSQIEINRMREAFENGEDPLKDVKSATDTNSIAGLLKLYFRELKEPLFPFYLFDLLTDFIAQIRPLISKLPRSSYILLRFLFAFLKHLSEFSDENMMDTYNLAICFGPTLLPIPEGKDQVIKNLIVHCNEIFDEKLPGPKYEKYNLNSGLDTPADTELELFVDDESGIDGLDGDGKQWSCGSVEASLFPYNYKNPQNIVPFLGRPIQLPNFCEQPQFAETINERELNFLNSEDFNQTGCITSPNAKNRATSREQKLTATGRREIQPEKFNDDFYTKYSLEVDRSMDHEKTSSSNIIMGTENVRNYPHNKLYSSIDKSTKTTASSNVPNTEELEVNDPTRFLSFYNPKNFPNENVNSHNPRQFGTNKGQMPSAIAIEGGRQCNKIDDLLNKLALQSNEKEGVGIGKNITR